jgi:hypothetical protein
MVTLPANYSEALFEVCFRDPVRRSLQDAIASLSEAEMVKLETKLDRVIAEAIAVAEARRPGALALALAAVVDKQKHRVYDIRAAITGGRHLLREHMRARKARYDDGRTAAAVWPEIRDQVLVQTTLYFACIAAGERFVTRRSTPDACARRLLEKRWFMLKVFDRAAPEPTGYFDRSVYQWRPGLPN